MESDTQFYALFSRCPKLFRPFAGMEIGSNYRFCARELKEISRRCDGMLESLDLSEPSIVVEFQVARSANVYPRIFVEMGVYQLENPDRVVRGVLIFACRESDPRPPTWTAVSETCDGSFRVLYLDEVLQELGEDHPLNAVFQPFLVQDPETVKQNGQRWLQVIRQNSSTSIERECLEQVFFSWLTLIFKNMKKEELMAAFGFDTTFEETAFYKEALEKGMETTMHKVTKALKQMHFDPSVIEKVIEAVREQDKQDKDEA